MSNDLLRALSKELAESEITSDEVQTLHARLKKDGFVPGALVRMKHDGPDSPLGIIVGYNSRESGFYPANRCPLYVSFERGTFEFSDEQFELVDCPTPPILVVLKAVYDLRVEKREGKLAADRLALLDACSERNGWQSLFAKITHLSVRKGTGRKPLSSE